MSWKNLSYWLKGGIIGLSVPLIVVLIYLFIGAVELHKKRVLFYERFKLCESCPGVLDERGNIIGRDLNCVIKVCETEANNLYYKPGYTNTDKFTLEGFKESLCHQPIFIDEKRVDFGGEPAAFVNGFCGYNRVRGFNYGKNPTFVGSFFNLTEMTNTLGILFSNPILDLLIVLFPIIGLLIGWRVGKGKVE